MKRFTLPGALVVTALLAVGCQDSHPPTGLTEETLLLNKSGGGTKTDTDPRANMVWAEQVTIDGNSVPAGIYGDRRDKKGTLGGTPAHEYQGAFCGVAAKFFPGSTLGELNADYDGNYASTMEPNCGPRRTLNFRLEGLADPLVSAPHFVMRNMWHMAVGDSRLQYMGYGIQLSDCQRVMFDSQYAGASDVRITRLADADGVRQWRVETQGTHRAMCVVSTKNGTLKPTGVTHYLPFSVIATEVPYPYQTYP